MLRLLPGSGIGVIVAGVFIATTAAQSPRIVVTDTGAVRGVVTGNVGAFLGIPYAAPPIGDLRWRPPQAPEPWTGIFDARVVGPPCPQKNRSDTSEDCLYVNVYAPADATADAKRPVMFWIHGGGLVEGRAGSADPTWLVERNVVVVTVGYRIGLLGFLAHAALDAESPTQTSGNYGLLDQLLALRWVRSNIAAFGGDPENVTIFGQSSGGFSVRALIASPLARDLFHKAIVQSGSRREVFPMLVAEESSVPTIAKLGCPDQTLACMRALSATELGNEAYNSDPVIDGTLITEPIRNSIASGAFNQVPVLEGSTHDEMALELAQREWGGASPVTEADYSRRIANLQRGGYSSALASAIVAEYPIDAFGSPSLAVIAAGTDGQYACRARHSAQAESIYVPTFQYEFDDRGAPMPFWFARTSFDPGSFHSAELRYLLPSPGSPSLTFVQAPLSAAIVEAWASFAQTGSPGEGWPLYGAESDQSMLLSLSTPRGQVQTTFAADHRCAFWERLPEWPN